MISFTIVYFLPLACLILCSLSAVSNSFYLPFLHSSPTLSRSLSMQSPSKFQSSSPPFPLHFLGICSLCQFFICHFFYMTSPCSAHQFLLRTFLHPNLHSHFIHFLLSALLSPTILFLPGCFSQILTFSCCFFVSVIVSSPFMYAGIIHVLSIFHVRWRDMRLSPITPSTFLQAFAPAEIILIVTKAINLADYALGKWHFLSLIFKL